MRITARQIENFQMAYRHRSTRKAADALHISQPAISRALAELEAKIRNGPLVMVSIAEKPETQQHGGQQV